MNWNTLNNTHILDSIDQESKVSPVLIFKHSTRCSISSMALNRIEANWNVEDDNLVKPYYLDLLEHRDISSEIENRYKLRHESPQILIISDGLCLNSLSHTDISYTNIMELL